MNSMFVFFLRKFRIPIGIRLTVDKPYDGINASVIMYRVGK